MVRRPVCYCEIRMGRTKPQPEPLPEGRKLEIVQAAIGLIASRIDEKEISASLNDLIRLLEIEAELSGRASVRETRATWVDPNEPFAPRTQKPPPDTS